MPWATIIREQLIPSALAILLLVVYATLILQGRAVPDGLEVLAGSVVAFYYGSNAVASAHRRASEENVAVATAARNGGGTNGGTSDG